MLAFWLGLPDDALHASIKRRHLPVVAAPDPRSLRDYQVRPPHTRASRTPFTQFCPQIVSHCPAERV
jgi:hypothetical protein